MLGRFLGGFLMCSTVVLLPMPGVAGVLTADDFVSRVTEHYPRLKSSGADVEVALAREMQASAGYWPGITLSAGYRETDDPVEVFGALLRQEQFRSSDFEVDRLNTPRHRRDISGGAHLRWVLFDGLATVRRVRSLRLMAQAGREQQALVRAEARLLADETFFRALALENILDQVTAAEQAAARDIGQAEDLKEKGMVLGADFFAARALYSQLVRLRNDILRDRKALQALMNIMMGEDPAADLVLDRAVRIPAPLTGSRTDDLAAALNQRSDLKGLAAVAEARGQEILAARSGAAPVVAASADFTENRNDLHERGGRNAAAGLTVSVPLLDPAQAGRVREARALRDKAQSELLQARDETLRMVSAERARREAIEDNLPVVSRLHDDARQAVLMTEPLYSEGRKSVLELEESRMAAVRAAIDLENLRADQAASSSRLLFLKGE